jgi:hypothetical protein
VEKSENGKVLADVKKIDDALALYQTDNKTFPYPDGNLRYYGIN